MNIAKAHVGCIRLGNQDSDFETRMNFKTQKTKKSILKVDFNILRNIQFWISWILSLDVLGNPERIFKTVCMNICLFFCLLYIMWTCKTAAVLVNTYVFEILFQISPKKCNKGNPGTDLLVLIIGYFCV